MEQKIASLTGKIPENKKQKIRKQLAPYVIGLLLALLPMAFLMLQNPEQVEAGWYNDNWTYRQKIVFGNSGSLVTNQKVLIEIDTATLISSGYMQSDCGDVRFTNAGGKILSHYLDSGAGACNTASTDFYVLFQDIVAGDNLSYIYYGNPNAPDVGEGSNFTQSTFSPSTSPTTATQETGPGPVGYWSFDEGADNTCEGGTNDICDSTQFANDGSLNGTATWQSSEFCITDNCLYFDGDGDYANIPDSDELDLTQNMTLSAWVKMNSLGTGTTENRVFFKGSGGHPSNLFTLDIDESNILFTTFGDNPPNIDPCSNSVDLCARGETDLETNTWYHIAATYDGSVYKVYLNGVLDGSHSNAGRSGSANSDPIYIGGRPDNSDMFTGFIDGIKIYPYARSAAEIATDYQQMSGVTGSSAVLGAQDQRFLSDGLVGYWSMEDNVSGDAQTISDQSGNDNDGTTEDSDSTLDCTIIGKFGFGCDFEGDGGDDVINFGDIDLDGQSASFTLSAWINVDDFSADEGAIFSKWQADNNRWTFNYTTSGGLFFSKDENDGNECDGTTCNKTTQSGVLTSNNWYHVAAVYNTLDKDLTMYVNGEEQNLSENEAFLVGPGGNSLGGGSDDFKIGRRADGNDEFNGTIDEARVYTRALSSNEVKSLYNWAPGPIVYYPMDDNEGTSISDKSGNGNTGSMISGLSADDWVSGKYGTALYFDGDNDAFDASDAELPFSNNARTLMAWVNVTDTGDDQHIVSYGTQSNDQYSALTITNGDKYSMSHWFNDYESTSSAIYNEWVHIAGVYDGSSTIHFYINGVLDNTITTVADINTALDGTLRVGRQAGGLQEDVQGVVDEVKIYNYARTQSQIIEDMNGGHPIGGSPVGSQVAYWKFDEGYGDTAYDNISNANGDLGGSGTTCPQTGDSACPSISTDAKIGYSLDFETSGTTDDFVEATDDSSLDITGEMSITAWVKPETLTASTYYTILWKGNSTNSANYYLQLYGDELNFGNYESGWQGSKTTNANISTGAWSHIAVSYSDTLDAIDFYVNGVLVTDDGLDHDLSISSNSQPLYFGSTADTSEYYDGLLDEVKIYTAALTQEQILIDMNANSSVAYGVLGSSEKSQLVDGEGSGPVAYYTLDESTYNTCSGGTNDICDRSGNGNDGTAEDNTKWANIQKIPKGANGLSGQALEFDGQDDYVDVDSAADDIDTTQGTLGVWINRYFPDTVSEDKMIATIRYDNGDRMDFSYRESSDNWRFRRVAGVDTANIEIDSSYVPINTWTYMTYTWNETDDATRFYVNGVEITADTSNIGTFDGQPIEFTFGGDVESNKSWVGQIDTVKLWDYTLTPAQIAYEYNRGGPVAHYKFDECQGTTAYDSSGNGNNGVISAGAGANTSVGTCSSGNGDEMWDNGTNGKFNASLDFDGDDDYVSISNSSQLSPGAGDISISAWTNLDSVGSTQMIFNNSGLGDNNFGLQILSSDLFRVFFQDENENLVDAQSTTTGSTGTWYHLVGIREGTEARLYVNGQLVDSDTNVSLGNIDTSSGSTPSVGASAGGSFTRLDGQIDDVRIYNYALSDSQVKKVMNEGAGVRFGPNEVQP